MNQNTNERNFESENFESFKEANDDLDSGIISPDRPKISSGMTRNTWLRTSLKRANPEKKEHLLNRRWGSYRQPGKKQVGSNALARSSSFNSSGRGSVCDTADEMYSDISLEEDVIDLNNKVQTLQEQVGVLTDNANHTDERFLRAKNENASLQTQILVLEEQLRDNEVKAQENLKDEQKRFRELLARIEREKELQIENCQFRLADKDKEIECLNEQLNILKNKYAKLENELYEKSNQISDLMNDLKDGRNQNTQIKISEKKLLTENKELKNTIQELEYVIRELHANQVMPSRHEKNNKSKISDLELEIESLTNENIKLTNDNKKLQETLLKSCKLLTNERSLANELNMLDEHDELDEVADGSSKYKKLQLALKDQQFVNSQLKDYIDYILLMIVEKSPQLLEIKR